MKNKIKIALLIALISINLCACGLFEACENCGKTPTRAFMNNATNENEYYCKDCSSMCWICRETANHYYTSGFEEIVFVCDDCYEYIMGINE